MSNKQNDELLEGLENGSYPIKIPEHAVKKKSRYCIVCGFDSHRKGESDGCYHWHKFISNRHQYIYYDW